MAINDNTSYELTGYQVKDLAQKIRAKADTNSLASIATSGLYSDLTGAPTIPTVYNGALTLTQGGTTLGTFTANSSTDVTIDIPAGGGGSSETVLFTDMISVKYTDVLTWMQQKGLNTSPVQGLLFPSGSFVILNAAGTELLPKDYLSDAFRQGKRILVKCVFNLYGGLEITTGSEPFNGQVLSVDTVGYMNYPFVFSFASENSISQYSTFSCRVSSTIGQADGNEYATFNVVKSV